MNSTVSVVGVLLAHRLRQDAERTEWGSLYRDHGLVFAREWFVAPALAPGATGTVRRDIFD